jgi:methionyl-tRNA formyltransferase
VAEHDRVWGLPVWERTLPILRQQGHSVVGFWTSQLKLANIPPKQLKTWYLRTFGIHTFTKLAIYASVVEAAHLAHAVLGLKAKSFHDLCRREAIDHHVCEGPNTPEFIDWLRVTGVDILVIMDGHILKQPILTAPRLGTINKHAALLPSHRGLFPYLWARLDNDTQAISFHTVVQEIDAGNLLIQEVMESQYTNSMVQFYQQTFLRYPRHLCAAIDALVEKQFCTEPTNVKPSYQGLPTRKDVKQFESVGGKIIRWRDIPHAFRG